MSLSKNELITKLETIAKLYNITTALQNKMDRFQPVDKYARQIAVPSFPGNYKSEQEREAWKKAIPHEKADAVEIAAATHRKYLYPKEPEKPVIRGFQEPPHSSENDSSIVHLPLGSIAVSETPFTSPSAFIKPIGVLAQS